MPGGIRDTCQDFRNPSEAAVMVQPVKGLSKLSAVTQEPPNRYMKAVKSISTALTFVDKVQMFFNLL